MSFWTVLKSLRGPVGKLATELLPDLIATIKARRAAGESDAIIKSNIRSRLDEVAGNRAKRDDEFEDKFGRKPGGN